MIDSSTSPQDLAFLLGTTLKSLNYALYVKGVSSQYTKFEIKKKSGGVRVIQAPTVALKTLQSRLNRLLGELYKPHSAATAFISGRGIVYNASKHLRQKAVFNIDLEDFYNNIHFGRVKGMLMAKPYLLRKDTAQLIAKICCVNGVLPQGAPTSPVISNMICRPLDRELSALAKSCHARYTRYADDITFSFHKVSYAKLVKETLQTFSPSTKLNKLINKHGFSVNQRKSRFQTNKERQTVTGIKVNQILNIDRRYIRTTRAMIHSLSKGITQLNNRYYKHNKQNSDDSLISTVVGRLNYIRMIKGADSTVFISLAEKFNAIELGVNINFEGSAHSRLKHTFPYYKSHNKKRLRSSLWVVSFEGVEGLSLEQELMQGTAFMIKGQRLMTASHVFHKAGDPDYCYVHRLEDKAKKYKAYLIKENKISDISELEVQHSDDRIFNYLEVSKNKEVNPGYEVAIVGFPEYKDSQSEVGIAPCRIVNTFIKSTYKHKEVDVDIRSGNSGGPVVDGYMNVVGMAVMGTNVILNQDVDYDPEFESVKERSVQNTGLKKRLKDYLDIPDNYLTAKHLTEEIRKELAKMDANLQIVGTNAFVSSEHFDDFI